MLNRSFGGNWIHYSTDDYIRNSRLIAYGLLAKGMQPGTKIAVVCVNRPEWNFLDMGCTLARCVMVPIYPTLSRDEFTYIFDHSDCQMLFVGTENFYKKCEPSLGDVDRDIDTWLIDDSETRPCLKQFLELGKEHEEEFAPVVDENIRTVSPDDVATIVYTSGTTGRPKGVMLTHRNLTFDAHGHTIRQIFDDSKRILSFLPLCHVYERTMNYESHELGISIWYAESLATIKRDLISSQADEFCAVPRVIDTFLTSFEDQLNKLKGFAKFIYRRALKYGYKYDNYRNLPIYRLRHRLFDKLVYSKWREALGGKETIIIVSGGSSIQPSIVRLFNAANLQIMQGYGLTETSPVVAVNNPSNGINKFGTAGIILDGTEVKFADDGEILVRGPHIMKGYYKDPEETAKVIDSEGWFHTGDIGCMEDGKYLKITDRKKEIFKLSAGKYVAPQPIENKLRECAFFDNCCVIGADQKFASAIIVVNQKRLASWTKKHLKEKIDPERLLDVQDIQKMLLAEVEKVNKTLADYEVIKRPVFVFDEWSISNGLLSQTLKPKRKNIHKHYAAEITKLYTPTTKVNI